MGSRNNPTADGNAELQQKAALLETEIAERKRLEDELKATLELLAESDRRKDEFLAMLGHELRNPLSAVRNAITTASLDESRRERALEIARRQADQLGRLIDDLLDVARITEGRIALRKSRIYLAGVIERAVESARSFIDDRGHQLRVSLAADDIRLDADPARLEQVIVNLLTNAAKYTEPGGEIEVIAERSGGEAVLRVCDTGIGISREVLPRVFDLFRQADRALDRAEGGLGIGLTIARRLVEMHGGDIEALSDGLGKGSEFRVRLPAIASERKERAPASRGRAIPKGGARVLIVEDNPDSAESLEMLLELLGHRVRVAHDGLAALDAVRASLPDVALVDIGLPGMDGYEVARRMRSNPALKGLVLVALTGYGREADQARAMAAGFDHHIVKPVNIDALQNIVAQLGEPESSKQRLH